MIPTQFFKAIRTESGNWGGRHQSRSSVFGWISSLVPTLLLEQFDGEDQKILVERATGEPCHLVSVALVDPDYLRALEALASATEDPIGVDAIARQKMIDRLRTEIYRLRSEEKK